MVGNNNSNVSFQKHRFPRGGLPFLHIIARIVQQITNLFWNFFFHFAHESFCTRPPLLFSLST